MATLNTPELIYQDSCGDCGRRTIQLPEPLPAIGDDFDWLLRDYDSFRLFMLEELAARFSERRRWTPADMEVVIVEALAVVLDQLSDMLDRVQAEAFLETARRPQSVRRLLSLIGYNAIALADEAAAIPSLEYAMAEGLTDKHTRLLAFRPALLRHRADYQAEIDALSAAPRRAMQLYLTDADSILDQTDLGLIESQLNAIQAFFELQPKLVALAQRETLEAYWLFNPHKMDQARQAGPRAIHTQKRMVTEDDYANRLEEHPLVRRAHAYSRWTGSWLSIHVAVVLVSNIPLDIALDATALGSSEAAEQMFDDIEGFHRVRELEPPRWGAAPTARTLIRYYLDAYRMAGQEVFLQDAIAVGIEIALSVRVAANYFQSEIRYSTREVLGTGLNGFFEAGRLQFGEDLHSSDIIERVAALAGVEAVCLNRFKRVGDRYADQSDAGRIQLDGLEIAVCDDNPAEPERGYLRITCHGGRKG